MLSAPVAPVQAAEKKAFTMPSPDAPILALDTGSPTVSLALGDDQEILAVRSIELRQSSERLLRNLEDLLQETGTLLADLRGIAVLKGPGSFTGLRVGLGTVLGLHQALGLPAVALPTLQVLATAGKNALGLHDGDGVVAAVDAIRGEWMAQTFVLEGDEPQAVDLPVLKKPEQLAVMGHPVVGFGVDQLEGIDRSWSPEHLAPAALITASGLKQWDPGTLVDPIYFRAPATTPPKRTPRPQSSTG